MQRYLGIDMHRDSCTLVVLSAGGKKTDQRVVPTEAAALVQYVKSLSGELHVCLEQGEWSEWVVEILSPFVARVVSASTRRGGASRPGARTTTTSAPTARSATCHPPSSLGGGAGLQSQTTSNPPFHLQNRSQKVIR